MHGPSAPRTRHLVLLGSYPSDAILTSLSADLDYICPHCYTIKGEEELRSLIGEIKAKARNKALKIAVTEWNHTASHWGWARAWLQTLFNALHAATMFNTFQRLGDMIRIANRLNMTNSLFSGVLQTNRTGIYMTPCYYVQKAYATMAGNRALAVKTVEHEALDLVATRQEGSGAVALFVVNGTDAPQRRGLDLTDLGRVAERIEVWTLSGPSLDAANSFIEKERVAPQQWEQYCQGSRLEYTFPPLSLTILGFTQR